MALGQSSLARPGQLLQVPPPTGLVVGGQRRRGGRKVKSSWVEAEFKRKETQQDGKTTAEYSCLHCQRMLTGLNATRLKHHLLNPAKRKFLFDASEEHKREFAAWLEIVRHAAEPDADGVAAVRMDVEQMEVDEEGEEEEEEGKE